MYQRAKLNIERLKSDSLWLLRQQVDITSTYADDYNNDFGIEECVVRDFFRSYLRYMETCAEESGLWDEVVLGIQDEIKDGLLVGCNNFDIQQAQLEFYRVLMYNRFDNEENLLEFYNNFIEEKRHLPFK